MRARHDREFRQSHRGLRFRRPSEFQRPASALWRPVFCPFDPAPDQCAHGTRPITACSIRSTCGCARRGPPVRWRRISTALSVIRSAKLDLGAYGADARARDLGSPVFAARVAAAIHVLRRKRSTHHRRRRRRDAWRDRQRKRRYRSLGSQIRGRRAGRYRVHLAILAARTPRRCRTSSIAVRRRAVWRRPAPCRRCWRPMTRRWRVSGAAAVTISRRFCGRVLVCPAPSTRKWRSRRSRSSRPAPPTCAPGVCRRNPAPGARLFRADLGKAP